MKKALKVHNSLSREKEVFEPLQEGKVGMYVCGPTVYSDVHLGNCRTFVSFDVIYRYLTYLGYQVRYVRNITDVGHLLDDGEDRMLKGTKREQLTPMEVAQKYTNGFHDMMRTFNSLPPSIEPRATGHIIEQIEMIQSILDNGYAYVKNGSVYFDTLKFAEEKKVYGNLSGRVIEDLMAESRSDLKNQGEKNHPSDFALWMKASPEHIMRWNSPWSVGFPGWHLECSAMSTKYLGKTFDIHGGGNDLKFPHHENEVAQSVGACNCQPARYWLHTNMLLMNGRKMSKSDGNTISPDQLFSGDSPHVSKGYSPMAIRFFMLQSHYRSTLDLTDDALQAAEKGYRRLMEAYRVLQNLRAGRKEGDVEKAVTIQEQEIEEQIIFAFEDMDDDFSTPRALSRLFDLSKKIYLFNEHYGERPINVLSENILQKLKKIFKELIFDVFGLKDELQIGDNGTNLVDGLMDIIIELRKDARTNKDWATSDKIRDALGALEVQLKDGKEGTTWMKN